MRRPIAAVAIALPTLGGTTVGQGYPTYERDGFPLTPMQLQVLGCDDGAHESAPGSTLASEGVPFSLHQLAVLRLTNAGGN